MNSSQISFAHFKMSCFENKSESKMFEVDRQCIRIEHTHLLVIKSQQGIHMSRDLNLHISFFP